MRPTTFERFVTGFFVAGFFFFEGGFFVGFGLDFFAGFDFNDAAARCNFPASAFRVEVGTAAPPAARARAAARFRRIASRLAFR